MDKRGARFLQWDETLRNIAASQEKLRRGMVWCRKCGRSQAVDAAQCLGSGWPECCGQTMTIEERGG